MADAAKADGVKKRRGRSGPRKPATLYFLQQVRDENGNVLPNASVVNIEVTKNTGDLVKHITRLNQSGEPYTIAQYPSEEAQAATEGDASAAPHAVAAE